ncbi:hypothetical protein K661_02958 [Piscirickettsia salmonis LF-89 = ATCC VR-1361]|nr:hypothetical protein K661_02958 [Piscirickettsia salmonis LF-89 = ATCC VR-1361]
MQSSHDLIFNDYRPNREKPSMLYSLILSFMKHEENKCFLNN